MKKYRENIPIINSVNDIKIIKIVGKGKSKMIKLSILGNPYVIINRIVNNVVVGCVMQDEQKNIKYESIADVDTFIYPSNIHDKDYLARMLIKYDFIGFNIESFLPSLEQLQKGRS